MSRKLTSEQKFLDFHYANPVVYNTLAELARDRINEGFSKIGVGMLWERMRWDLIKSTTSEDFKLNNNYRSRYARLLMEQEPDLASAFETRVLRTA